MKKGSMFVEFVDLGTMEKRQVVISIDHIVNIAQNGDRCAVHLSNGKMITVKGDAIEIYKRIEAVKNGTAE